MWEKESCIVLTGKDGKSFFIGLGANITFEITNFAKKSKAFNMLSMLFILSKKIRCCINNIYNNNISLKNFRRKLGYKVIRYKRFDLYYMKLMYCNIVIIKMSNLKIRHLREKI